MDGPTGHHLSEISQSQKDENHTTCSSVESKEPNNRTNKTNTDSSIQRTNWELPGGGAWKAGQNSFMLSPGQEWCQVHLSKCQKEELGNENYITVSLSEFPVFRILRPDTVASPIFLWQPHVPSVNKEIPFILLSLSLCIINSLLLFPTST